MAKMGYLMAFLLMTGSTLQAENDLFLISDASIEKIHADEFIKKKTTFAESPALFKNHLNVPKEIAFEDSRTIHLTPGDIIKISEDLTFSYWGAKSAVAEEDFTLGQEKKKVEESSTNSKGIKFSM